MIPRTVERIIGSRIESPVAAFDVPRVLMCRCYGSVADGGNGALKM